MSGDACRPVVGLHSKQLAWHTGMSYVWLARTPNPDVLAQKMKATWVLMEESALVEFLRGGCIASVKTMGCFQDVCSKFCAR